MEFKEPKMSNDVKRVYRSRTDKVIAGVCGGLAHYFHIDPIIMRIIFIVLGLLFFLPFPWMVLLYLVMWIIVPNEPVEVSAAEQVVDTIAK